MAGNKQFGKNLKRLRESCGLSQETLAELVGLEYQSISRIETGLYFTSYENLIKISKALDVTIKDLFDYQENVFKEEELRNHEIKALSKYTVRHSTMHTKSEFLIREHPARTLVPSNSTGRM